MSMELKVVGTGSSGNCYILGDQNEALIIEAGMKFMEVKKALNYEISKVVGCIVSHSHSDHCKYAEEMKNAGIQVFGHESINPTKALKSGCGYKISSFRVIPLEVQHDVPCFAYLISHEKIGKLLFVTDTMTFNYNINGVNHIMIEANYEDCIIEKNIENGYIPNVLRDRIMQSHMSLENAINTVCHLKSKHLENVILIHLSSGNSNAKMFSEMVAKKVGMIPTIASKGTSIDLTF